MKNSEFRWGNSHWAFTLVLSLLLLSFVCFYAHINYASSNGNQFLAVAATLASIILAVVAIVIAVAQMVMSGQQGAQFEGRMGELRGAIDRMAPLPSSVDRLEELIGEVRLTHDAVGKLPTQLSDAISQSLTREMNMAPSQSAPMVGVAPNKAELIRNVTQNTVAFVSAAGVVCACHGKAVSRSEIVSEVLPKFIENSEGSITSDDYNFLVNGVAVLLRNFSLCKFPADENESFEVDEELRLSISERLKSFLERDQEELKALTGIRQFMASIVEAIPTSTANA